MYMVRLSVFLSQPKGHQNPAQTILSGDKKGQDPSIYILKPNFGSFPKNMVVEVNEAY